MPVLNISTDALRRKILLPSNQLQIVLEQLQLVACQHIVTLNATVIGDGLPHTVHWEQLSGTPVTFLETTEQTMTTFEQPAIRDDKIFRFYVDKGLDTEKFKDILITSITKDPIPTLTSTSVIVSYVGMSDGLISYGQPAIGSNGSNVVTLNNTKRSIVWKLPTSTSANIVGIRIFHIINGVDHFIKDIPKSQNVINNILAGNLYRLDYIVNDMMGNTRIVVGPFVGSSLVNNTIEADTWEPLPTLSSTLVQVNSTVFKKELSVQQVSDSVIINEPPACVVVNVVVTRSLVRLDPIMDLYSSGLLSSKIYVKKEVSDRTIISIG